MKILFVASRYSGGIGGHAKRIADKLRECGHDIELLQAPHIPIKNLKNPTFTVTSTIKALLSRKKYDVVHAFNVPSAFAMRYTKAKIRVLSVHGMYSEQIAMLHSQKISALVRSRESDVLRWADRLMTNSKNVQQAYKKLGFDLGYIYGPTDTKRLEKIRNDPKNGKQIAYIGRDSYEKGIDVLKKTESKIQAKVVYCTDMDWEGAMGVLKSSDIIAVPSRIDNIPNVIKEAFFLKIPIVATDVEGISEVVTDDVNGVLVPSESSEKLAEAINLLLDDKIRADRLAESGYEFAMKTFTWDVLLPRYLEFYEGLLAGK